MVPRVKNQLQWLESLQRQGFDPQWVKAPGRGHSCGSDSILGPGISKCCGCGRKEKKVSSYFRCSYPSGFYKFGGSWLLPELQRLS